MNVLGESHRKRLYISMTTILLLTVSIATVSISHPSYASTTVRSGVVIPLYSYPDSTWTTIAQTAKAHPNVPIMVIINPNNGPGPSSDPVYLAAVQKLQSAGVTVLGYVDMLTGGGTLPAKTVPSAENQVDAYHNWYGANGIFFDDFNNGFTYSPATYATLDTYVKAQGMTYTMGKPGTSVSSGYIGTLDNLVIYESSGYPSLSFLSYPGYP